MLSILLHCSALAADPSETTAPPGDPRGGGTDRIVLALASVGGLAAGAVWFFEGGTYLGAGDPAALLMGASFVGLTGASVGSLTRLSAGSDAAFDDRVAGSWVSLEGTSFGTTTEGERRPASSALRLSPQIHLGEKLRLTPSLRSSLQVGPHVDVDPRPQGDLEPALRSRSDSLDLSLELRAFPGPGIDRRTGLDRIDFIARPLLQMRFERIESLPGGDVRRLRRTALVPLTLGARYNVSERQRFEVVAGPQLDGIAWSGERGEGFDSAPMYWGAPFMAVHYDIHVPYLWGPLEERARSRLRIAYTSSQFAGLGIDTSAVIGYIGPLTLQYDTEWRSKSGGAALLTGLSATLAEGGSAALTIGFVPPTEERWQ